MILKRALYYFLYLYFLPLVGILIQKGGERRDGGIGNEFHGVNKGLKL